MKTLLTLSICTLLSVAAAHAQKVRTDFDPTFDFDRIQSFSWQSGDAIQGSDLIANNLVESRVRQAVTSELRSQGISEKRQNPDLLAVYHVSRKNRMAVDAYSYRVGPRWQAGWTDVMVTNYSEGTLILDLIDAETNRLVWRAYCSSAVSSPKQAGKKIDKATQKAFKQFPPQS